MYKTVKDKQIIVKYMKKLNILILAILVFCTSCKESTSIKVGTILPLTDFASYTGELVKKGIELANDSLNGDSKLEFIIGDNQSSPSVGMNVFKEFQMRGIKIFLTCGGPQTMSFASLSNNKDEVLFVTAANMQALTEVSNRIIRMSPTGKSMSSKLAEFNYDSLGMRRTAILYLNLDMGVEFLKGYKNRFEELGGEIVSSESYEPNQRDFKDIIQKTAFSKPDILYLIGSGESLGTLIRQTMYNPLLSGIPITGDFNFSDPSVLKMIETRSTDIYYADIAVADTFKSLYEQRFNEPVSSYAAFGYSMVQIYHDIIVGENITKPIDIYNRIINHSFKTAINTISFDKNGEPEFTIITRRLLKNGK